MIYIESRSNSPFYNFALEYYLMTEKEIDDMVFMFWRTTPTLMVGRFQNTYSEINLDYARKHNLQIVRRKSGGGTIYTDMGSWQFTFITPKSDGKIDFARFIEPIVEAVRSLGADVNFNGRNDLVVGGRKFSGNAQYMKNGKTLHHGSILFDTNIEEMVRSTTVDEYKIISKGIQSVRERVTNLSEHLPAKMSMEEFKQIMVQRILADQGSIYELSEEEIQRIQQIEKLEFDNWDKIFGESPACSINLKKHFTGGTIQTHLDVDKGIIRHLKIYGDFFGDIDIENVCSLLIGCPYEKKAVMEKLKNTPSLGSIYGIRAEEFVEALF